MAGTNIFDIGNLVDNPSFDFIKAMSSNTNDNDDSFSFLNNEDESPYNLSTFNCKYIDTYALCNSDLNNNFNILSLNVQSLPAKFAELKDLLDVCASKNFFPDIILLQEIWQVVDPALFALDNYQPLFYKCRAIGRGGGVGIYVKVGIKATIHPNTLFMDNVLETLLLDVCLNKKTYVIGSVYRCIGRHATLSPRDQFNVFNDLLYNLLDKITSHELILGGGL
jgi:hypothetical protein